MERNNFLVEEDYKPGWLWRELVKERGLNRQGILKTKDDPDKVLSGKISRKKNWKWKQSGFSGVNDD